MQEAPKGLFARSWRKLLKFLSSLNHFFHASLVIMTFLYLAIELIHKSHDSAYSFLPNLIGETFTHYASEIALGLLLFSALMSAISYFLLKRNREALLRANEAATDKEAELRAQIQRHVAERDSLKKRHDEASSNLCRYRSVEFEFRLLAQTNAVCDRDLFECLFLNANSDNSEKIASVVLAIEKIKVNIRDVLNSAANMFTSITRDNCAACVKIISKAEDRRENSTVSTLARDSKSNNRRNAGRPRKAGDNTIQRTIFIEEKLLFIEDDITKGIKEGKIDVTPQNDFASFYNATIVALIPEMGVSEGRPIAALCIDNQKGGFKNPICEHFAQELAWRLSVMLYRLRVLEVQRGKMVGEKTVR